MVIDQTSNFKKRVLLAIPFIVLAFSILVVKDKSYFFMSWVDPTYPYLFNGLNLASGHWTIGITEHPGTPLEMITMIIIKAVHLFRSEPNVIDDVIRHPELYIKATVYFLILLSVTALYMLGQVVFRITNSIAHALFLQLTTLFSFLCSGFMPNLMTEPVVIFCGILMVMLTFEYTFGEEKNTKNFPLLFAIVCGLSFATKFPSLSINIIPFIILRGIKNKIRFSILSLSFFFLFTLPIWYKYHTFLRFITGIATHTQNYGSGSEGFIEAPRFIENIGKLLVHDVFYSSSLILLIVFSIVFRFTNYFTNVDRRINSLIYALLFLNLLQIAMVAKHFSYHYLITAHCYIALVFYTSYCVLKPKFSKVLTALHNKTLLVIGVLLLLLISRNVIKYQFFPNLTYPIKNTSKHLTNEQLNYPRILVTGTTGAFIETALLFGKAYSGERQDFYSNYLKQKHPNSYFYTPSEKRLYDWGANLSPREICSKHSKIVVYENGGEIKPSAVDTLIKYIVSYKGNKNNVSAKLTYENDQTLEKIYELICDTLQIQKSMLPMQIIKCDAEQVNKKNNLISIDEKYEYMDASSIDNTIAKSGNNSIKLNREKEFGLSISFPVSDKNEYEISVWRKSLSGEGNLVVSAKRAEDFYQSTKTSSKKDGNGWEQLKLNFTPPKAYKDSVFVIYVWNPAETETWFDDLEIKVYEK